MPAPGSRPSQNYEFWARICLVIRAVCVATASHVVSVQTRECIEGDAGEVMRGYYTVTDDVLTMCAEDGKPSGNKFKLQPGDDSRLIASRLLRQEMLKRPPQNSTEGSFIRN